MPGQMEGEGLADLGPYHISADVLVCATAVMSHGDAISRAW